MAGEQDGVVGNGGEPLGDALVHGLGIAAGEVGSATSFEEQRVAGDETFVDEEALTPGGVPGRVHEADRDVADAHLVTAVVDDEIGVGDARDVLDPRCLRPLHVQRCRQVIDGKELANTLDRVAHEITADVVGVVVRHERTRDAHAVDACELDELAHAVRGVDDHGVTRLPVADHVHEVDHLTRDEVVLGEVPSCKELAEVEPLGHGLGHY